MIILVDLGAEFWRAYFATRSDLDAYTITVDRVKEYVDAQPKVVVCCDCPPLKRSEWFTEYKANRDPKPREALDSLRAVEQQIESWGTPILRCPGYEADDLIASLVSQANGEEVRILTHDKDIYTLLSDTVRMVKKSGEYIDAAACVLKFGVQPNQMLDFLTLVGDAADNVPGCPGVGPGRARDLLVKFGTLDAILAATDQALMDVRGVGEKTLTGLRSWDPALARQLVTLLTDAPVSLKDLWKDDRNNEPELVVNW